MGWPRCLRLSNEEVELFIATEIGPRILHFGFIGRQNIFHLVPDHKGKTGGALWRIYGGHRLWLAPEVIPGTYAPDNDRVSYSVNEGTIRITGPKEAGTGMVKEMEISLAPERNEVKVLHRIINHNAGSVLFSPWAISVLRPGGTAIIPQEPYGEGDNFLLPARSLALWNYTLMKDPRWIWGNKYILAKQDSALESEQKIGVLNKQGWTAYALESECFIKCFNFDCRVDYPDMGCNHEVYFNGEFLEQETLGAFENVSPLGIAEHTEHWLLSKVSPGDTDESIDRIVLTQVAELKSSYESK